MGKKIVNKGKVRWDEMSPELVYCVKEEGQKLFSIRYINGGFSHGDMHRPKILSIYYEGAIGAVGGFNLQFRYDGAIK